MLDQKNMVGVSRSPFSWWSKLNVTKIGDTWGKVIRIDFPKGELEDYGELSKDDGNLVNMEINAERFPMHGMLRKKSRDEEKLVAEVRRDLGLEELGLVRNLEDTSLGQVAIVSKTSPTTSFGRPSKYWTLEKVW